MCKSVLTGDPPAAFDQLSLKMVRFRPPLSVMENDIVFIDPLEIDHLLPMWDDEPPDLEIGQQSQSELAPSASPTTIQEVSEIAESVQLLSKAFEMALSNQQQQMLIDEIKKDGHLLQSVDLRPSKVSQATKNNAFCPLDCNRGQCHVSEK
ncbi:unnamed protein product [Soboliphyme baturini]|uniref:Rad21_Rec8 domain-containing protein n=1 Tax=Soboliphyme baturini TaxID=241478 RepID=A0A183J366_9BILA|nr:unnamed protein product [Soboliphyme baturini]